MVPLFGLPLALALPPCCGHLVKLFETQIHPGSRTGLADMRRTLWGEVVRDRILRDTGPCPRQTSPGIPRARARANRKA